MAEQSTRSLKVLESYTYDVGKGMTRIDYDSMDTLGASTGNVIELRGKRRTVAKCLPLNPIDEGKAIIRLDALLRNNAGVAIGDTVVVRKINAVPAEKVIVAPFESIPPIDERFLATALESVPMIKGDKVMVPYFADRLIFKVNATFPSEQPVVVNVKTVFRIIGVNALGVTLRIEYGVRSEADKTFLRMKFILSHHGAEQVGEFEKELARHQVQEMFAKYRNTAELELVHAEEQVTKRLVEEGRIDVDLADIVCAILDRCQSIKH